MADQMRGLWRDAVLQWRTAWKELSTPFRIAWVLVVAVATVGTVVLGAQLGSAEGRFWVSIVTYALVPAGAGVFLVVAAQRRRGPGLAAWTLIGVGVGFWGVGELIWQYYAALRGVDVPYPGWADVFFVLGYPIMFAGVVMLPHVRARKWERVRLSLDSLAGTVALGAVVWTFYLRDAIYLDPAASLLENTINLAYPVGDLILLIAFMILASRRSPLQFDGRLLLVSLGMATTAVADMAYVFQIDAGTFAEGGRIEAVWLAAYGLFAVAALLVAGPPKLREHADQPGRMWPMIAPYTAIAALFALTLGELGGQATILQGAAAAVGILIIARQGVAIRETRDVIEKQRNDMVASIAHELRTPLTAMAGFIEILDHEPDLERSDRVEIISIVNSQTKHLTRIVGDLVAVARDRLDNTTLASQAIDVASLVGSAIGMLTNSESRMRVATYLEPGLIVAGDTDRLRQVIVNFLTNADRYGDGIVEVHAQATDNGQAIIEVHDNGPGIPKKYEFTIWDRFERGAHTYLSSVQGSGLGLAIARQLVTAQHGQTGHRPSERLGGACFWLTLPTTALIPTIELTAATTKSEGLPRGPNPPPDHRPLREQQPNGRHQAGKPGTSPNRHTPGPARPAASK